MCLFVQHSFLYPLFELSNTDPSHLLTQVLPSSRQQHTPNKEASKAFVISLQSIFKESVEILVYPNRFVQLCSSEEYLRPLAVRTLKVEALFNILIWAQFLIHFPVKSISDKTTVTMENLQANLFFLHDLGDPLDLENPTKIAYRRYVKQCTKAYTIVF